MATDPPDRPLRIAVVTSLFPLSSEPYRGIPIYYTVEQLTHLAEVEVFVPLAVYPPVSWLQPKSYIYRGADPAWQPPGVRVQYCEYSVLPRITRPINGQLAARRLIGPLRRFRPDVVLAYWIYPDGHGAAITARSLGVPLVVGSRGSDLRPSDPFTIRGVRSVLAEASAILTVSGELRDRALELGAPAERIHVILNGCDASVFAPGDRVAARRELGVDESSEVVLFVGHLIPVKGVTHLMTAAIELAARRPRLELVLVGEGQQHAELEAALAASGAALKVRFAGAQPPAEVARWMRACDVFCLPSLNEGCPNVVIEALSTGRPVVASSVGAIPDLLDETRGILTPPREPRALAAALDSALDRRWDTETIAASARRGWDAVARQTLDVCRAALAAPRH
ncbi:MAG: glycosyltransferase [Paludibaculum sp.]